MLLFVSGKMQLFYFLNRMEDGEKEWRWERKREVKTTV